MFGCVRLCVCMHGWCMHACMHAACARPRKLHDSPPCPTPCPISPPLLLLLIPHPLPHAAAPSPMLHVPPGLPGILLPAHPSQVGGVQAIRAPARVPHLTLLISRGVPSVPPAQEPVQQHLDWLPLAPHFLPVAHQHRVVATLELAHSPGQLAGVGLPWHALEAAPSGCCCCSCCSSHSCCYYCVLQWPCKWGLLLMVSERQHLCASLMQAPLCCCPQLLQAQQ